MQYPLTSSSGRTLIPAPGDETLFFSANPYRRALWVYNHSGTNSVLVQKSQRANISEYIAVIGPHQFAHLLASDYGTAVQTDIWIVTGDAAQGVTAVEFSDAH